jgi:hypothetical protein
MHTDNLPAKARWWRELNNIAYLKSTTIVPSAITLKHSEYDNTMF